MLGELTTGGGNNRPGAENDSLSINRVLDLLSDPLRRQTISYCTASDRTFDIDDLLDHLVHEREESTCREINESDATELSPHHLPKLADEDIVEFDPRSGSLVYQGDDRLEKRFT